jgi:hypothetical protein
MQFLSSAGAQNVIRSKNASNQLGTTDVQYLQTKLEA